MSVYDTIRGLQKLLSETPTTRAHERDVLRHAILNVKLMKLADEQYKKMPKLEEGAETTVFMRCPNCKAQLHLGVPVKVTLAES